MDKKTLPTQGQQGAEEPQVLIIGGCKVTVSFSEQDNPSAAKTIKDALLTGGATTRKI